MLAIVQQTVQYSLGLKKYLEGMNVEGFHRIAAVSAMSIVL
jgi:hypothetical protein